MTGRPRPAAGGPAAGPAGPDERPVLSRLFFDRPVLSVAPALLGCVLVHDSAGGPVAAEIVETEAYLGEADPASHAFRGRTARNAVMFGPAGHAYVYFTYGMHFCVNLVCQGPGEPAAVLLRAGRVIEGTALAASRRGQAAMAASGNAAGIRDLARGPARLCQALAIGREQNGADVCDQDSPLRVLGPGAFADPGGAVAGAGGAVAGPADGVAGDRVADGPAGPAHDRARPAGRAISCGPRVGVRLGAEEPWRFWLTGDPAVSAYRPHVPKRRPPAAGSS